MTMHKPLYALVLVASLLACSAAAQGISIDRRIDRVRPAPQPQNIQIKSHAVETTVDGQTATTTITQVFYNPNNWQLEGVWMFPLPAEAAITNFQMSMNDKMVTGELLDSDKARGIYRDTVRKMIDPGLLEYAGRGLYQASVFPILAQKDMTIKFTYSELLPYDSGLVKYSYPLRTESFCATPVQSISVKLTLKGEQALRTIYSPTHSVEIIRKGELEAVIGLELKDNQPASAFELFYGYAEGAVTANVMSYRDDDKAGYFLALLTPKVKLADDEILPKDVIVVLDSSGSMLDDDKITQAKKALKFVVAKLNAIDRFALITFSTEARKLHDKLITADQAAKDDAVAKIDKIEATGGTNVEQAIRFAYEVAATGVEEGKGATRPCYVLLFSDGIPTMGEVTEVKALAKIARESRAANVRIFPFGVGNDVNTWLLDTLAEENKGQREYVKPKEDMEVKVSNFASKISSPVLADIKVSINGAEIHDLHPQTAGDVFAGTQLSILGRYDKPGSHQLILEGTVNGEKRAYEYTISLAAKDNAKAYLPRMWAVRRVGYLMDQINLKGFSQELKDEIVRLGTQFGIVTPYTSFLIVEDDPQPMPRPNAPMPEDANRGRRAIGEGDDTGGGGGAPRAPSEQKGGDAVAGSKANADRRESETAEDAQDADKDAGKSVAERAKKAGLRSRSDEKLAKLKEEGWSDAQAEAAAEEVIKTVGTRSFVWSDGIWLESDLTNGELFGAEVVEYMSDRYFEISEDSDAAKVMALGTEVIFRFGKTTIRVVEKTEKEKQPD